MQTPKAFDSFSRQLHQDVKLIHGENFVEGCVSALWPKDCAALKPYIGWLLETKSNAELKGLLQRSVVDLSFTGKSARALFEAMAVHLRS